MPPIMKLLHEYCRVSANHVAALSVLHNTLVLKTASGRGRKRIWWLGETWSLDVIYRPCISISMFMVFMDKAKVIDLRKYEADPGNKRTRINFCENIYWKMLPFRLTKWNESQDLSRLFSSLGTLIFYNVAKLMLYPIRYLHAYILHVIPVMCFPLVKDWQY